MHGGKFPDKGAFAEYIKIDENRAFKVPAGMKSEVACQLGVGWITAAMVGRSLKRETRSSVFNLQQGLYHHQKNPYPPQSTGDGNWVGVMTSVLPDSSVPRAGRIDFRGPVRDPAC